MATPTPISDLPELTSIAALDIIPIHQVSSNRTKKVKYDTLKNQIGADLDYASQTDLSDLQTTINAAITAAINTYNQDVVYAVGKTFTSATDNRNPNTILGFGTWVAVDKFIAGFKSGDADFSPIGKVAGSKTHQHGAVTGDHALTASENGPHTHTVTLNLYNESGVGNGHIASGNPGVGYEDISNTVTGSSGTGAPHNHPIASDSNLPPYEVFYIWKRTA